MGKYQKSENILSDIQTIIEKSQKEVYHAVNTVLIQRNWLIGYRIAEEELKGQDRANYGTEIIKKLSKELKEENDFLKNLQLYTERVLRNQICIVFILFTKHIRKFSRQCLENLNFIFHGRIMLYCQKCMIRKQEIGMNKKRYEKLGVFVHFKEMLIRNIIIEC